MGVAAIEPVSGQDLNRRVLIVDDNPEIHADFERTLRPGDAGAGASELDALKTLLLGASPGSRPSSEAEPSFELDHANQGEDAIRMVAAAAAEGRPYALAFMDVRMPPGIDGVETTSRLWRVHDELEVVLCSAHSDYTWEEILRSVGRTDRLLMIKKPFHATAVQQMTLSLCMKWSQRRRSDRRLHELGDELGRRDEQLARIVARLEASRRLGQDRLTRDVGDLLQDVRKGQA